MYNRDTKTDQSKETSIVIPQGVVHGGEDFTETPIYSLFPVTHSIPYIMATLT